MPHADTTSTCGRGRAWAARSASPSPGTAPSTRPRCRPARARESPCPDPRRPWPPAGRSPAARPGARLRRRGRRRRGAPPSIMPRNCSGLTPNSRLTITIRIIAPPPSFIPPPKGMPPPPAGRRSRPRRCRSRRMSPQRMCSSSRCDAVRVATSPAAMAFCRSWYSSHFLPQMRSSAARCSRALALLPVSR